MTPSLSTECCGCACGHDGSKSILWAHVGHIESLVPAGDAVAATFTHPVFPPLTVKASPGVLDAFVRAARQVRAVMHAGTPPHLARLNDPFASLQPAHPPPPLPPPAADGGWHAAYACHFDALAFDPKGAMADYWYANGMPGYEVHRDVERVAPHPDATRGVPGFVGKTPLLAAREGTQTRRLDVRGWDPLSSRAALRAVRCNAHFRALRMDEASANFANPDGVRSWWTMNDLADDLRAALRDTYALVRRFTYCNHPDPLKRRRRRRSFRRESAAFRDWRFWGPSRPSFPSTLVNHD